MPTLTPNTQSPFPPYFPSCNAFFLGAAPSLPKVAALMAKINCCALNFPRLRCRRISAAQFLGSKEHLISNESPKTWLCFPKKNCFCWKWFHFIWEFSFGNFVGNSHWGFLFPSSFLLGTFPFPFKHLTCPKNDDTNKAGTLNNQILNGCLSETKTTIFHECIM